MPIASNPHGLFCKIKQKSWKNFGEVEINKIYTEKGKEILKSLVIITLTVLHERNTCLINKRMIISP